MLVIKCDLWSDPSGLTVRFHLPWYSDINTVEYLSLFFFSFLYLYLYLLGDEASISKGYFMRTKYLFVLIHIINKVWLVP